MATLYWEKPDAKKLAAFGLKAEDYPSPECNLWPDNWFALSFYLDYATQWRQGAVGATGLDYNVLFYEMDRRKIHGDEREDLMQCIRVIENAALEQMYKGK